MQEQFHNHDFQDSMKNQSQYKNTRLTISILQMSQFNFIKKIDLKVNPAIWHITQLDRHLNKRWNNSGLMPKTKNSLIREETKNKEKQ